MISKKGDGGCLYSPLVYGIATMITLPTVVLGMLTYYMRASIEERGLWIIDVATYVLLASIVVVPFVVWRVSLMVMAHSRAKAEAAKAELLQQAGGRTPVFQLPQMQALPPVTVERPNEPESFQFGDIPWSETRAAGSIQRKEDA